MKWITVWLFVLVSPVWGQNAPLSDKQIEALSNVEMELSMCIAYFNLAKNCAPDEMREQVEAFDPTIESMMGMVINIGKGIGMTPDAALSRMAGKCVNFSSLMTRYAARCKQVGENLDSVYNEYMNR